MKNFKQALVVAILVAILGVCGCGKSEKSENAGQKVLARIGAQVITLEDFEERISQLPYRSQVMAQDNKERFLDELVNRQLLLLGAAKLGLEKDADIIKNIEEAREQILISKFVQEEVDKKVEMDVTDDDAKSYYEKHEEEFFIPEKVKASHILVEEESKANQLLVRLSQGGDFAVIAKENSICPSKERGGDIGFFSAGQMLPEFEKATLKLKPGELSGVVKSAAGFHIIKVTSRTPGRQLAYEDVERKIKRLIVRERMKEKFDKLIAVLKQRVKVEINGDLLEAETIEEEETGEAEK